MMFIFLDMNRLVTRSWLSPCPAGSLRRLVFWGLGRLPIIQLERAHPLLPIPSLTLWWDITYCFCRHYSSFDRFVTGSFFWFVTMKQANILLRNGLTFIFLLKKYSMLKKQAVWLTTTVCIVSTGIQRCDWDAVWGKVGALWWRWHSAGICQNWSIC